MRFNLILLMLLTVIGSVITNAQQRGHLNPGNGNPVIPGYFADPTVKKFNDTYYIYATTDGNGGGLGPSQVWTSKDFVNWTMQDMNWPTTHNYWAPDVARGNDGNYYLYYCQPTVEVYGASSATPVGPWNPLFADGKAVIPNYLVPGVITLDGQTFKDDDGKFYMAWGTWGIYKGYGCGVGLLNPDMRSFAKTAKIPNTDATDFFEAPFLFKRKGLYYLLYSSGYCENETYRVQYAVSKTSPMSGFVFGKNNPVLATTADGTVHGPGHQSVLQVGDDYYLVYHRHNNPHSNGGYHRQVCADKLLFDAEGNILKVLPTHTGIGFLGKNTIAAPNLAYQQKVTASSFYNENFKPEFAADDNNGTLWKPKTNSAAPQWLQVDLGKITPVKTVLTQFEYASWYYQYKIEYSADGKTWQIFADKRSNTWHGSPYVDRGDVKARFLRLTITNTAYPGLFKAVWNLKVYGEAVPAVVPANIHQSASAAIDPQKGLLISLDASKMPLTGLSEWQNTGVLKGVFKTSGNALVTDFIAGKKAVVFNGKQFLTSDFKVPLALAGNNSYTVSFSVYTKNPKDDNPVLSWAGGSTEQLTGATFGYGLNRDIGAVQHFGFADMPYQKIKPDSARWHQVTITFDGAYEKIYVDGRLNSEENKMLFVQAASSFLLGGKNDGQVCFSGALASLKVYDYALDEAAVKRLSAQTAPAEIAVYLDAAKLNYGRQTSWDNEGATGGSFTAANGKPVVKDVSGRIALCFASETTLKLGAQTLQNPLPAYSFAFGFYADAAQYQQPVMGWGDPSAQKIPGKNSMAAGWHFLVQTCSKNQLKTYLDGILTASSGSNNMAGDGFFMRNADKQHQAAIANLMLFNHALSDQETKKLNQNWLQNLHPPVAGKMVFGQKPKAVSPQLVEMEAINSQQKNNLQYDFIRQTAQKTDQESGWTDQPYYLDGGLQSNQTYSYRYKIRDNQGNVTAFSQPITVRTDTSRFAVFTDDFSVRHDYLANGTTATIWNGFLGKGKQQTAISMVAEGNQQLKLASENSNWDGNYPYGPFLYKTVQGDFVAQVTVADVSGLAQKQVAGNNDAGLMLRAETDLNVPNHTEQLLQNSVFPAWNVGNMLTNFAGGNRQQSNNQSAWNFNRFLQIQRQGNLFYTRTSSDGINWHNLPGSPVLRTDLNQKSVQLGLYQCTYGPKEGYGSFAAFKLYLPK